MKAIDLSGKTAVVTGGTGKLGRAMVRALAECGADVAICYHSQADFARELKTEVEDAYGVKALAAQADVTNFSSITNMKERVNDALGTVDIIVNNSVIQYKWKTLMEQDIADFDSQYRSCVLHSVYMAKAFVPDMVEQEYGRVIGVNTECMLQMFPYQSAYVAGKRGMDGVYKVLAKEVGPYNVTVNQVAPGWIKSAGDADADGSETNIGQDFPYIDRVPMRRRGTENEVADAVCFLASDMASFMTGVYLPVAGGNVVIP